MVSILECNNNMNFAACCLLLAACRDPSEAVDPPVRSHRASGFVKQCDKLSGNDVRLALTLP